MGNVVKVYPKQEQLTEIHNDITDIIVTDVAYLLANNNFEHSTLKMIRTKLLQVQQKIEKLYESKA